MTKTAKLPCEMPRAWRSDSSMGFPRISARINGAASNLTFPSVVFVSEDDPVRNVRTGLYTRRRIRVCFAPPVRCASTPVRRGASVSLVALFCSPRGLPRCARVHHLIRFLRGNPVLDLYTQSFLGYGEGLLRYNERSSAFRLGFALYR